MVAVLFSGSHQIFGQPEFGMEYISELQLGRKDRIDLLQYLYLSLNVPISDALSFRIATITDAETRKTPVLDDYMVYSNVAAGNRILTLAVANLQWAINDHHSIYLGIRNTNEDYFTSEGTAFFANSSCGIYPTISCNYDIANFPFASPGVHYLYSSDSFELKSTLYNGLGHRHFAGRDNVFRFCPKSDGVFLIGQGEYKHSGSIYSLGACMHYGIAEQTSTKKDRTTLWTHVEHALSPNLCLIGGYSHSLANDAFCKDFGGLGFIRSFSKTKLGIYSCISGFAGSNEYATEVSYNIALNRYCYLQPTVHYIKNSISDGLVGVLRFGIEI